MFGCLANHTRVAGIRFCPAPNADVPLHGWFTTIPVELIPPVDIILSRCKEAYRCPTIPKSI